MNKKGIHIIVVVVLLSLHLFIFGENKKEPQATFKLEKAAESKAFFDMGFVSVSNMAVDLSGNVFLLDSGKGKIVKLDRNLEFKTMFGDKGQGPGEFSRSYSISVDKKGNVYVHNTFIKMIRYSGDGKLIDETRISNSYNGTYGFVLNHPVYVLSKMSLSKNFKVMVVDISKKKILSEFELLKSPNYALRSGEFYISPTVDFVGGHTFVETYDEYCVIGEGERFFVRLFDSSGKLLAEIKKDGKPQELTSKEADFVSNSLNVRGPGGKASKKDIRSLVGSYKIKNFIHNIKISKNRIYIFPVPDDIRITKKHFPVEIYDFKGKPVTKGCFPKVPKKIHHDFAYFVETTEEDDDEVGKLVKYRILKKN